MATRRRYEDAFPRGDLGGEVHDVCRHPRLVTFQTARSAPAIRGRSRDR